MRNYLDRETQQIRDKLLYEVWERHKNEYTMEQLSKVFNTNLKTAYRIIKQWTTKHKTK